MPENLFSMCDRSGFDENLGPEENTFRCLMNAGDVALVNITAAKNYYSGIEILLNIFFEIFKEI